jgi:hypothetical protein
MSRMTKWFVFTCGFGLLPFGFAVLFHYLHDPAGPTVESSPELLFFSLAVTASTMGELWGVHPARLWKRRMHGIAFSSLLIVGVFAAALYGAYVSHGYTSPARSAGLDCRFWVNGGGRGHDAVRTAAEPLIPACREWLAFADRLFTLSIALAIGAAAAGTVCEWFRPGERWRR